MLTKPIIAARLGLLSTPLMLIGCAKAPSMTMSTSTPLGEQSLTHPQRENQRVFDELLVMFTQTATAATTEDQRDAPGPQLVAGDWLAFQCALVGGYGGFAPEQVNAPAFARAPGLMSRSE